MAVFQKLPQRPFRVLIAFKLNGEPCYAVESESRSGFYLVDYAPTTTIYDAAAGTASLRCSCPHSFYRKVECKHARAVNDVILATYFAPRFD